MRLARRALLLAMLVAASASMGCLRPKFNLCADIPPHPDCPRDAGPDSAIDAPLVDAPLVDAPVDDAPIADAPVDDAPGADDAASGDASTGDAP